MAREVGYAPGMAPKAVIDRDKCVGSGACVVEAPEAFAFDDGNYGVAVVLPGAADLGPDRLQEVADLCPMDAISVTQP